MTHERAQAMVSINPFSGEELAHWPYHSDAEVDVMLDLAAKDCRAWGAKSLDQRASALRAFGAAIAADAEALALTLTREVGKPLAESRSEVAKCVEVCGFYAERAAEMLAPTAAPTEALGSHVRYEPLGVIFAVMPWNFPLWQVMRFAAPALMAGNAMVFKHAPNTQGCAEGVARAALAAGLPQGLLQVVRVPVPKVEGLIADPRVAAVTVTGSERAGRAVAEAAGRHLKKSVLELGGSDPFIVLEDAPLDTTVAAAVRARCFNGGQTCCAGKRFIVLRGVAEPFMERFVAAMQALKVGDPMDPDTDMGALARADLVQSLHAQVERSVALGAQVQAGGYKTGPRECSYAPTVLTEIPPDSPAATEELFGPVAAVFIAEDHDHALKLANDTEFGLAASVWTQDMTTASWFAERLECGAVFVNRVPGSDPRLPFGGVKSSGYGRELGLAGLRELVNVKAVWIDR